MEEAYTATVKTDDIQCLRHQCHSGLSFFSVPCDDGRYNMKEAVYIMSKLSAQQASVLALLLQDYSRPEIAYKMNIRVRSVKYISFKPAVSSIVFCTIEATSTLPHDLVSK